MVDIVASVPARSSAARALVEYAVRAWRYKYPTSKVDDCAVVCLFLDPNSNTITTSSSFKSSKAQQNSVDNKGNDHAAADPNGLDRSGTVRTVNKEIHQEGSDDDPSKHEDLNIDWSALEGVSRVNTLLTLPRFTPGKDDEKAAAAAGGRK